MSFDFVITDSEKIPGVKIIEPSISRDNRGNIWTSFLKGEIDALLPGALSFKHDKFSDSKFNVLRGIHGDHKSWKLVTSVFGEIHQVVVDCRTTSATYMQYDDFIINNKNQKLILIPPGLGNAYYVRSENAVYHYKLAYEGNYIDAQDQFTFKWNDSKFAIGWGDINPILSNRDMKI
ncbi:dTDP-4-dehydrorhamnose 3,5-epimerase family protein [Amylibacter sp.]|nr:dTDP-4-dehydrorhamnose 3,5-epimerase family protein [Amylibacter sp.]